MLRILRFSGFLNTLGCGFYHDKLFFIHMMGEYIIYYHKKIIGGIYDDRFLVKPTKSAKALMPEATYEIPYAGAKEMLLVDEWVRVADTHEAIIDRETFEKVQALLKRDTRTAPRKKELHLFSGFLRCADCEKSITRSQSGKNVYYACSTYKYRSRTACSMHSIKHERLEAAVLFAVRQQVHLAVSFSEILARINSAPVKKSQSFRLDDLIAAKEKELAKITRYKQSLYQDWKDGEITQQDYRTMKADYERQISSISDVLKRLAAERAELANGVDSEHPALVAFKKHQNIETLNREILIDLVNYIKVYENGNISVKFKFADEFRRIAEYIEINISEIPAAAG